MSKQEVVERIEPTPVMPPQGESSAIISMIERAARDPSVDIDKFERLMAMKERVEQESAKRAFHEAMSAAQGEIPQVVRNAENSHTRSKYATLEAISKELTPIITRHGFSMSFDTADSPLPGHYRLVCQLGHSAGYCRDYHADLPSDAAGSGGKVNKTAIQAFGSTISYGRRYLTMLIFNVAITNEDNDGNSIRSQEAAPVSDEMLSAGELSAIRNALVFAGKDEARFCKHIGVAKLEDVYADKFTACLAIIKGAAQ